MLRDEKLRLLSEISSVGSEEPPEKYLPEMKETRKIVRQQRLGWDLYFLKIAEAVALRADCSRRQVGAIVVRENRIVATGYNGSPPGGPSCLAGECPRAYSDVPAGSSYDTGAGTCIAAHAEQNAIIYAGRSGCLGSTIYITAEPCAGCARMIEAAGVKRVVTNDGNWLVIPNEI